MEMPSLRVNIAFQVFRLSKGVLPWQFVNHRKPLKFLRVQ